MRNLVDPGGKSMGITVPMIPKGKLKEPVQNRQPLVWS